MFSCSQFTTACSFVNKCFGLGKIGGPSRTLTCNPRGRSSVLYTVELWNHMFGLPGPTRTANLQIRSLLLCPVELREDLLFSVNIVTVLDSKSTANLAVPEGFEPPPKSLEGSCPIHWTTGPKLVCNYNIYY